MIKAVIFDCDGVLFDSEPYFELGTKELIRTYGIELSQEIFDRNIGGTGRMMCEDILNSYPSIKDDLDTLNNKFFEYTDKYLMSDSIKPFEGLYDFVKKLHNLGYRLAVASSSPKYYVQHKLDLFNIAQFFDLLVCGDDVTKCKPDPQVYNLTVEKLDLNKEECIVIEDATNGIKSAKNAGLYCIAYKASVVKQDTSLADEEVYNYNDIKVIK